MKQIFLSVTLLLGLSLSSFAQIYYFEKENLPYSHLTNPTLLEFDYCDSPNALSIPLNIDFDLFDTSISEFVLDEGILYLADESLGLAIFLLDYTCREGLTENSPVSYELVNTQEGNIFVMEWNNQGIQLEYDILETTNDFINMQIRLYEDSNIIEFHYGPSSLINITDLYTQNNLDFGSPVAIGDILIGGFEAYLLEGDPAMPEVLDFGDLEEHVVNGFPESGTVYRFTTDNPFDPTTSVLEESIHIFPNPTSDELFISFPETSETVEIKILNLFGQIVLRKLTNDANIQLEIDNLTNGVYIVEILYENSKVSKTVLKN